MKSIREVESVQVMTNYVKRKQRLERVNALLNSLSDEQLKGYEEYKKNK